MSEEHDSDMEVGGAILALLLLPFCANTPANQASLKRYDHKPAMVQQVESSQKGTSADQSKPDQPKSSVRVSSQRPSLSQEQGRPPRQ